MLVGGGKAVTKSLALCLIGASLCLCYILMRQKPLWEASCKGMFLVLVRTLCNNAEPLQALLNCESVNEDSVMQWVRGRTGAEPLTETKFVRSATLAETIPFVAVRQGRFGSMRLSSAQNANPSFGCVQDCARTNIGLRQFAQEMGAAFKPPCYSA